MLSIDEYRAIFAAAPDGIVVVSSDGTIRGVNPKIEQMFGWTASELDGRPIECLLPDAVRDPHVRHRGRFIRNPHDRPMGVGLDLRAERKDGSTFPVEVSLSPWRHEGNEVSVICSVRDISAIQRLRNFSEGALRASEDERQRIARELHDDTAQRLATLILRVRLVSRVTDEAERAVLCEQVRQELVDTAEGVKRIARGLRPPELEELGLDLALQAHARALREAKALDVEIVADAVDPYLDDTSKLALYRIVQEALSNARRHSGASSATVSLRADGGLIVMEIVDRGSGFEASQGDLDGRRGLGIVGMQERAAMAGGRLQIDSTPGEGTRIRVEIPSKRD